MKRQDTHRFSNLVRGVKPSINSSLGITILLVEQNANLALEVSDYGYVLETGRIILHDRSSALRANEKVKSAYLGGS